LKTAPPRGNIRSMVQGVLRIAAASFASFALSGAMQDEVVNCTLKDIPLHGRVQIVDSFPDLKVRRVESFPDLKVQIVESFPDECGQWQIVESFPDFTVQFVDSFADLEITEVSSFPGE
jgi:hypothetical protein